MSFPIRVLVLSLSITAFVCRGQVVAPTPELAGPTRGDDWKDYNIVNSMETGYRFATVSGNQNNYRSHENFGDGVRLLSNFLGINSKSGHGKLFDEFVLTTGGLGGDPYQSASLRIQKNRIYEYNLLWRKNDYFNPGLTTDGGHGQHLLDTSTTLQDNALTLFPQSRIKLYLGYSRSLQDGPGVSTVQLFKLSSFDSTGDVFPVFTNVHQLQNDYRLGGELHWWGITLNLVHGWEDFKDDSADAFRGASPGDNATNNAALTQFSRTSPNHGTSPYWQVALFRNSRWIDINGRFTYTSGRRAFLSNESALGTNQFGALANQQIVTFGSARRPVATGNLTVSVFPSMKLTLVNHTSIYNIRTDGESAYLQFDNATRSANLLYYQYLGIRTVANDTDLSYEVQKWLTIHAGYEYSNRRIGASSQFAQAGSSAASPYLQTNELNTGKAGFRVRPIGPLTITVNAEVGRASRPFTPKSDKSYNLLTGRIEYKKKSLRLAAWSQANYNDNSVLLSDYNSHGRSYSGSAAWVPLKWFAFDASYSKLHLETLGGIAFFAQNALFSNQLSYYVTNLHSVTLGTRFSLKRADLYFGLSRVQDTGDGRAIPTQLVTGPDLTAFRTAQTFPLTFLSPQARISFRISERLRWNAGYQYFGYREDFSSNQNYLANTGYTSLSWSF